MEENKNVKNFIKKHGAEIAIGASCIAGGLAYFAIGYKVGVKLTTDKFMKDACEAVGDGLAKVITDDVLEVATDIIEDCVL